jgi:hypothetical protein
MGFAKLTCEDNDDIKSFGWFSVGEFFRFQGDIYVKSNNTDAVCVIDDSGGTRKFSLDEKCENIEVRLIVL